MATNTNKQAGAHGKRLYINPLPVRLWHWFNALAFIVLILSGLQIRYIGEIDLGLAFRSAVLLHNYTGFALGGAWLFWLLYNLFSDKITVFQSEPTRRQFYEAGWQQLKYYSWGMLVGDKNPHHVTPWRKFNPLQSMTYQIMVMVLLPIQFCTGLLLWNVKRFSTYVELLGGVRVVDTVHVVIFIIFTAFVCMHAYMASLGDTPTKHFKEMFTGYEDLDEETAQSANPANTAGKA